MIMRKHDLYAGNCFPQGSVLGPIPFVLYTVDAILLYVARLYADDTQVMVHAGLLT